MTKMRMLSYLRNPYGIDEHELREARLQAADELEKFYAKAEEFDKRLNVMIERIKVILEQYGQKE